MLTVVAYDDKVFLATKVFAALCVFLVAHYTHYSPGTSIVNRLCGNVMNNLFLRGRRDTWNQFDGFVTTVSIIDLLDIQSLPVNATVFRAIRYTLLIFLESP